MVEFAHQFCYFSIFIHGWVDELNFENPVIQNKNLKDYLLFFRILRTFLTDHHMGLFTLPWALLWMAKI